MPFKVNMLRYRIFADIIFLLNHVNKIEKIQKYVKIVFLQ